MFSLCEERPPQYLIFEDGRHFQGDLQPNVERIITQQIALDMVIFGCFVEAITTAGARTLLFAVNWRDGRDQQWVIHTVPVVGALVPAPLIAGTVAEPFIWPMPRVLRRGASMSVHIRPELGVTIAQIRIVFLGARLKLDGQGVPVDELMEYDMQDRGYAAIAADVPGILAPNPAFIPSPTQSLNFGLGNLPYDIVVTQWSLIQVLAAAPLTPVVGIAGEVRVRDNATHHNLMHDGRFVPFSFYGGQTQQAAVQETAVRPVASDMGAAWRLRQDSTFELAARAYLAEVTFTLRGVFHGWRDTCLGRLSSVQELRDRARQECVPEYAPVQIAYPQSGR